MIASQPAFPEGKSFWELARRAEEICESNSSSPTDAAISDFETKLGDVVSLLYRMACCHWGCHEKEHVFEYLAGRTCTSAQSAYRLVGFGYYDEALALTRNIAEIGNLVFLFFTDSSHIRHWLDSSDRDRMKHYSPASVRKALLALGAAVPTDGDRYSWLCEVGTHVNPKTRPEAHNDPMRPILGAVYQREGRETCLHALAWAVGSVSAPIAKLAEFDRDPAERLFEASMALIALIGALGFLLPRA